MTQRVQLITTVTENQLGQCLGQVLAESFPDYPRPRMKEWILDQRVLVDDNIGNKPKEKVLGGEHIAIDVEIEEEARLQPQDIPLNIVYEDDDIFVINKPRDLVIYPSAGNPNGTVLNAPLHYYPPTADMLHAGIVHRLDKDTTDLMVVTEIIPAQARLVGSLQLHEITREYEAVTIGHMTSGGTVEEPISRHPTKRTHMAVHLMDKPAITHCRTTKHSRTRTRLRLRLETGRTHQICVYMSHVTHSLVGDQIYDGRPRPPKGASEEFITALRKFGRQALHATVLCLYHPITDIEMGWHTLIPQDIVELIETMRVDLEAHKDDIDWL